MNGLSLVDRIVMLHEALDSVPHAFGGALALAYYAEPRATVDIDVNVFVPVDEFDRVSVLLDRLGVTIERPGTGDIVGRNGQVRVFWDDVPVDVFFSYDSFHDAAARSRRAVPFADSSIEILSPEHLIVCKAVFNRPRDWVDIQAMMDAGTIVDVAEVLRWVGRIAGDEDHRFERVANLLSNRQT